MQILFDPLADLQILERFLWRYQEALLGFNAVQKCFQLHLERLVDEAGRERPRIVESAELLAGLIQPGFFAAGMPSDGWTRL